MKIETFKNWKIINESMRIGTRSPEVETLQNDLINMGYSLPKYGVDGKYGQETKMAVMALQDDLIKQGQSLPRYGADGIYGKETKDALAKSKISKSKTRGVHPTSHMAPGTTDNNKVIVKDASLKNAGAGAVKGLKAALKGKDLATTPKATAGSFDSTVQLVIDTLEGGYYHPDMLKDGRIKDSRYSNSGETMFGMDRKAGYIYANTPAGKKFWGIIDKANARYEWKWNYKGGKYASELKPLVSDMIKPAFDRFSKRWMSDKTREMVENDDRLRFHFAYATWNGSGWFKKFAGIMNKAIESGITDSKGLEQVAIDSRTKEGYRPGTPPNSLLVQGAEKIVDLFSKSSSSFNRYEGLA